MQQFVVPGGKVGGGGVEVAWGKVDCQYRIAGCDWQGDALWSPGRIGSHGGPAATLTTLRRVFSC